MEITNPVENWTEEEIAEICLGEPEIYNAFKAQEIMTREKPIKKDNMEDKCGWEAGVFNTCKKHREHVDKMKSNKDFLYITWDYSHCPFCGERIKPEEEPEPSLIIKKSCNTWVARYEGVDWLMISLDLIDFDEIELKGLLERGSDHWKPISEIEITDQIALLRPMIVLTEVKNAAPRELIGVKQNTAIFYPSCFIAIAARTEDIRIAHVGDLG